jgi:hypothetical protein
VGTPEGLVPPPALSWLGVRTHLGKREPTTGHWKPVSNVSVQTPYGSGELSVNEVEGGQFLEKYTGAGWTTKVPDPPQPAIVVVLVVQRGEDVVFVTGQADGYILSARPSEPDCLVGAVRKLADGMVLAARAVGDR